MEAPSTLADALLNDLDDLSEDDHVEQKDEEEEDWQEEQLPTTTGGGAAAAAAAAASSSESSDWWPARQQKRLLDDPKLKKHVGTIRSYMDGKPPAAAAAAAAVDKATQEQDHKLLVQTNQFLMAIANDLQIAHDALCQHYEPKFPELEELISDPMQYMNAVRVIGNAGDLTDKSVQDGLHAFLSNHQTITLSVANSTTAGRPLTVSEMDVVNSIVNYMEEMLGIRNLLTDYVEQQMQSLAPSMCELVGPATAAKLLALTGGLQKLSKIPACNLQVLGQVKQHRAGGGHTVGGVGGGPQRSSNAPHQGILADTELVQRVSRDLRAKALKVVAAKLALAIRCDFVNVDTGRPRSSASGRAFREQIEKKFVKLQEPDKAPVLKALPKVVLVWPSGI